MQAKPARSFAFESTPAVLAARARSRFVACPLCKNPSSFYLFHRRGVRFVRCSSCGLVFVNPTGATLKNYFDVEAFGQHRSEKDRRLLEDDFEALLGRVEAAFSRDAGRAPRKIAVLGRYLPSFETGTIARRTGVQVLRASDAAFEAFSTQSDIGPFEAGLGKDVDVLVLNEALEACADPAAVLEKLRARLPASTWIVVTYANIASFPARMMRRHWPRFFDHKVAFFDVDNLTAMFWNGGYTVARQFAMPTSYTVGYALERFDAPVAAGARAALNAVGADAIHAHVPTGTHVAVFRRREEVGPRPEKLSIIFPVFNEARYVAQVLEALIAKQVKIEKEIIVVESNSTDGTREIVRGFEGRPGVRVIYEEKPRGKGHAVRTGLEAVTGSIILIQDADFEYDLDDYDALLEPILQRQTSFVLGSRSLGLDDWKVRKYANNRVKGFLLNFAQVMFAKTFNAAYQKDTTDINTMFKVFRTECLEGVTLECDGFNLDIELVCKLVKRGYAPLEVPVNYVGRSFDEGKKISFVRDALPSYYAILKYRLGE
jgi:ribosomal protein S27E